MSNNTFFTDRNNKNQLNVNLKKEKKRILLLVDMYNWSFHNIAKRIQKELTNYDIDILSTSGFYNNIKSILKNPYIFIVFFYPSQIFSSK